ncbi:MAG: hypothetical protein RI897_1558 [Verrucomicrobiota bacterium]|jgi:hypothetical protein
MNPTTYGVIFAGWLLFGMLGCLEAGRHIGNRRMAKDPEGGRLGVAAVEGAVFGLLGLLIAFTFSGAASRFDARRELVVTEANNIGTAWLRLDLLPPNPAATLRDLFRQYLDSRLGAYQKLPDIPAAEKELAHAIQLQGEIWTVAVAACRDSGSSPANMLLLPALNEMFDITTTRTEATKLHPPTIIFVMLGGLALASALLAGFGMAGGKSRSWIHMIGLAGVMALSVYVIVDLEYPRLGLIRVDGADPVLIELRASMNP